MNTLVILFIHHFSPSPCPCELSPVDFIMAPLLSGFQVGLVIGRQWQIRSQKRKARYFPHSFCVLVSGLERQVHPTLTSVPTRCPLFPGYSFHCFSSYSVSSVLGMIIASHCLCNLRASPLHVYCLHHCKLPLLLNHLRWILLPAGMLTNIIILIVSLKPKCNGLNIEQVVKKELDFQGV